jgi:S1-C subfamily serine protease
VVSNVQPAVVNITAQGAVREYFTTYDAYFRRFRGERSTPEQSIGSGLLVSADGYVVTNAHVVALAEKTVAITLSSGSKYTAEIVTTDEDRDLALLKIEDKTVQFPYFDLNFVSPNYPGETVIALGSPAGYQGSVSMGILSAKNRTFTAEGHTYANLIQTDAAINPGNSGGPLVDLNGSLVGINSAKLSGEAIESIGFAIPNDVVVGWVTDALAVARGEKRASSYTVSAAEALRQHFGIKLQTIDPDEADALGIDSGLGVKEVEANSPADAKGVRAGMVLIAIGTHPVVDEKSLPRELLDVKEGDTVHVSLVQFRREGVYIETRGRGFDLVAR